MGICGNVFENLKFGLSEKKTTIKHTCSKCGNVDEETVTVAQGGLNFGETPGSGFQTQCPWNNTKGVKK